MNASRVIHLWVALIAVSAIIASFYMGNVLGMQTCILCLIQRIIFGLLGAVALVAVFYRAAPLGLQKFYAWSSVVLSIAGIATAARQIWLQHQPLSITHNCLPRFSYMVENMPLKKTLSIFKGTTNCSEFVWTYQGLSLAAWAAVCFGIILLLVLAQALALRCANGACELKPRH